MKTRQPWWLTAITTVTTGAVVLVASWAAPASQTDLRHAEMGDIRPCATEDGAAPSQTYPCVWDGLTRGNGEYAGPRFIVYYRGIDATGCPVAPHHDVRCYDVDAEWGIVE